MDRKKQIAALTDDEGERLLLAQACERLTRAEQRGIPAATVFLTPREQALLRQLMPQCRFWGGTPDAERAVAYWLPEYEDEDDYRENGPVACLRAAFFEENAVGHRDMLGALHGLRHPPRGRRRPVPAAASMRPVRHGGACTVSPRQPDLRRAGPPDAHAHRPLAGRSSAAGPAGAARDGLLAPGWTA